MYAFPYDKSDSDRETLNITFIRSPTRHLLGAVTNQKFRSLDLL